MLIGDADNAVVFDFQPEVDAGAEMLGRRGEDQRFEETPSGRRSAAATIDEAMADRAEDETRADVARRLGTPTRRADRRAARRPRLGLDRGRPGTSAEDDA